MHIAIGMSAAAWMEARKTWLKANNILSGTPYLIQPDGRYDLVLHRYFDEVLSLAPANTQRAAAVDLKCFFDFLWFNRAPIHTRTWRDATRADRIAYKKWRLFDEAGPQIQHSSWDREVVSANNFFRWAVEEGYLDESPIVTRVESYRDQICMSRFRDVPRESSHTGQRRAIRWFTPAMYRLWRDVGVRGHLTSGGEDPGFRGRWAARHAAYTDAMIRTGLRISEQTSLSVYEIPESTTGLVNFRTLLPSVIAKGGTGRAIYLPRTVLEDIWDYVELERRDAIDYARAHRLYERIDEPLFINDPADPKVLMPNGKRRDIRSLGHTDRRRVLIRTSEGLAPAALWLNQFGMPSRVSAWESMFDAANDRCERVGVALRCNPHLLRHSFAVITLEQLWRGHLEVLGAQTEVQRRTYQMVYGDPLRWVQMRLGHARMSSTLVYQHTLHELEMETRMALIPDGFESTACHPDDARHLVDELE